MWQNFGSQCNSPQSKYNFRHVLRITSLSVPCSSVLSKYLLIIQNCHYIIIVGHIIVITGTVDCKHGPLRAIVLVIARIIRTLPFSPNWMVAAMVR